MSGGQQQRVAIARAIVAEPGLVLFDEPLSNLDRELRENMVTEIGQLVANLGLTAIYVTHDQSEAFSLADQVAVMRAGVIEQLAAPGACRRTDDTGSCRFSAARLCRACGAARQCLQDCAHRNPHRPWLSCGTGNACLVAVALGSQRARK